MRNINHPKFSCRIYAKNVYDKDKAVQYDLCELWIEIKCNKLNYLDYSYLRNCDKSWYCIEYCSTFFPFNSLSSNKHFLACCTNTDGNITTLNWVMKLNCFISSKSWKHFPFYSPIHLATSAIVKNAFSSNLETYISQILANIMN